MSCISDIVSPPCLCCEQIGKIYTPSFNYFLTLRRVRFALAKMSVATVAISILLCLLCAKGGGLPSDKTEGLTSLSLRARHLCHSVAISTILKVPLCKGRWLTIRQDKGIVLYCHCEAFSKRCGNLYPFVPPLCKGRWLALRQDGGIDLYCHCEAFSKRCGNLYPFVPPLCKGIYRREHTMRM